MDYVLLFMMSSLVTQTFSLSNTLIEPKQVKILPGIDYHFSIDYCTISIPPYITTMNAHCYCFYNPTTKTSYKCSIPGPTFIFYPATTVKITWYNRMKGDSNDNHLYFNQYKDLDITNLHTHGLHISPYDDDAFITILPGASHTYRYNIPSNHYPGTHWLHAHHHGSVSFQLHSGLFSALLIKYWNDDDLGDDNLINMNENLLIFHSYYIITTNNCNCTNNEWKEYFYYPSQFELDDCISGRLCFQVFSYCYEYCSFPETQRLDSSFKYDIKSDYDNDFQLFLVNGQFRPNIDLTIGTFRRLRFINAMGQYYIQYKFPIRECEWFIIAIDGIFLNNNEKRSINSSPYEGYYLLPSGGRLDVIVKCNEIGVYNIITSENNLIDVDLENIIRVPELNILFHITVRRHDNNDDSDDDDTVNQVPLTYPERPQYLTDLTDATVNICGCNTYFENNNNTKIITWDETDCGIVLNMQNDHNINGVVFDPYIPSTSLEYGEVYSFTFIPHMHPYHQHVIPFQLMTDIGTNGFQGMAGDWFDTIGGPREKQYTFRIYPIDYTGHQVAHCHILSHEDQGMMTYFDILEPHQTCDINTGQVIGTRNPTPYPTMDPTAFPTANPTQEPTSSPTTSPTSEPTPQPTPGPTAAPISTPNPTEMPSGAPTDAPTPTPTTIPTIHTPQPTDPPTINTFAPTLKPTKKPTKSPIREICPIAPDIAIDFIVLYDNSCGLSDETCEEFLDFVGEVISSILDTTNQTRVQTMATKEDGQSPTTDIVVTFDNKNLQNNPARYVDTIKDVGDCTNGGNGDTNLEEAIMAGIFDLDDLNDDSSNRIEKFIIINACSDNSNGICNIVANTLDDNEIDVYVINFMELSDASNVLTDDDADDYLLCIVNNDATHICIGENDDLINDDDDNIIDDCLLNAGLCNKPTQSPTSAPADPPTPEPTTRPSNSPVDPPTPGPTGNPSVEPTPRPSPTPSDIPTISPIPTYTPQPTSLIPTTKHPTENPSIAPIESGFLGEICDTTEDCYEGDKPAGITCSCYTKMSWKNDDDDYDLNAEYCCILKGFYGCTIDNDCCKIKTICLNGQCVHQSAAANPDTPTAEPTYPTRAPTDTPTLEPIVPPPTHEPTGAPTDTPTPEPTKNPTQQPTDIPTCDPTPNPTQFPTDLPTKSPTYEPTKYPSEWPTKNPTQTPTEWPTKQPIKSPTMNPAQTPVQMPVQEDKCFLGSVCSETEDCCGGDIDERELGITCDGYDSNARYCCILKNNDGCKKDEDCCRSKSVCWWGECVNQSDAN